MKKYLLSCKTIFILFFSMVAMAAGDPVSVLQSVADQMIAGLKANRATIQTNPGYVFSLANRIVVPHADLDEMAQRVLPARTWNSATSAQKAQFKKEFTTILIRTYASALASYTDQTVEFFPVRGGYAGKSSVRVNSKIIRNDGPPISVVYNLVLRGSEWKLYDMTVEGVSLLQSFRSQFADKLQQQDMAMLLNDLSQHNSNRGR